MIEKIIISYLSSKTDVPIGMEKPKDKTDKYIVLSKIDAGVVNQIKAATFTIDCYAKTLLQAAELCEQVEEYLFNAITLDSISSASLGSARTNIDTTDKTYCYQCVFNFYYY